MTKMASQASTHNFTAPLVAIGDWTLVILPQDISAKLPSRGMVLVEGTINGHAFKVPLEPDGRGSHWLNIDHALQKSARIAVGDTADIAIQVSNNWPEPTIPRDVSAALTANTKAYSVWNDITPMARWDWLRWIAATGRAETRAHHIDVAMSKLGGGMRRPCCFNRSMCTVAAISKSGVLLEPDQKA